MAVINNEFAGDFETHLTVAPQAADAGIERLRAWAARHGCRFTHIELAAGVSASQPMLTRANAGSDSVLSAELAAAEELRARLCHDGFKVTRVKVEASPFNAGVPVTDADAAREPAWRHFEYHAKLLLPTGADLGALTARVAAYGGHVSRNALRSRTDGRHERFVTQRCYGVGRAEAGRRFAALLAAVEAGGDEVLDREAEYVVHDDNVAMDAGWIDAGGGGGKGHGL